MGMNWKIVGGAATVALGLVLFAPGPVAAAAPLLIFAACPLSMRVMMRRTHDPATLRQDGDASRAAIARGCDPKWRRSDSSSSTTLMVARDVVAVVASGATGGSDAAVTLSS